MRITYENEILRPPELVFPWIAEAEKAMRWQKEVKGGVIIINKPEKIGTTFTEVIEEDGKRLEMQGMITQYIENKIIGFHLESKIHEFDISYSLEKIDKASRLSVEAVIKWKFPMNIVSLFFGKRMEKALRGKLEAEILELKKICEAA